METEREPRAGRLGDTGGASREHPRRAGAGTVCRAAGRGAGVQSPGELRAARGAGSTRLRCLSSESQREVSG